MSPGNGYSHPPCTSAVDLVSKTNSIKALTVNRPSYLAGVWCVSGLAYNNAKTLHSHTLCGILFYLVVSICVHLACQRIHAGISSFAGLKNVAFVTYKLTCYSISETQYSKQFMCKLLFLLSYSNQYDVCSYSFKFQIKKWHEVTEQCMQRTYILIRNNSLRLIRTFSWYRLSFCMLYRVALLKWARLTFLMVTFECIVKKR